MKWQGATAVWYSRCSGKMVAGFWRFVTDFAFSVGFGFVLPEPGWRHTHDSITPAVLQTPPLQRLACSFGTRVLNLELSDAGARRRRRLGFDGRGIDAPRMPSRQKNRCRDLTACSVDYRRWQEQKGRSTPALRFHRLAPPITFHLLPTFRLLSTNSRPSPRPSFLSLILSLIFVCPNRTWVPVRAEIRSRKQMDQQVFALRPQRFLLTPLKLMVTKKREGLHRFRSLFLFAGEQAWEQAVNSN